MEPAPAGEIRHPRDLALSAEVLETFDSLMPHLTDEGRRAFIHEIVDALAESAARDNLRPVQDTLEAWHRTLIVISQPNYRKSMEAVVDDEIMEAEAMTAEELRQHLRIGA